MRIGVITDTHERWMTASERVHMLRSSFLLPFDRLRASSTPCHGELVEARASCLWSFFTKPLQNSDD